MRNKIYRFRFIKPKIHDIHERLVSKNGFVKYLYLLRHASNVSFQYKNRPAEHKKNLSTLRIYEANVILNVSFTCVYFNNF